MLAAIAAPTLILWGEDKPQLPLSHVARFEKALTAAPAVVARSIAESGHLLPVEQPRISATLARQFLNDELVP